MKVRLTSIKVVVCALALTLVFQNLYARTDGTVKPGDDWNVDLTTTTDLNTLYHNVILPLYPWIPNKYSNAAHTRDPIEILGKAKTVQVAIEKDPDYQILKARRPTPVTLNVNLVQKQAANTSTSSNANAAAQLRTEAVDLMRTSDILSLNLSVEQRRELLTRYIKDTANNLVQSNLDALFVGLANALPPTVSKQEFFQMSPETKLRTIEAASPNIKFDELKTKVDFSRFPNLSVSNWIELHTWISDQVQKKQSLRALILVLGLNQWPTAQAYFRNSSNFGSAVSRSDFPITEFVDELYKPNSPIPMMIAEALQMDPEIQTQGRKFNDLVSRSLREVQNRYAIQPPSPKAEVYTDILKLQLREVSPLVAHFRGYVANNCSTEGSASYVLLPTTRVFFLYKNGADVPSAYIELIRVIDSTSGQPEEKYLLHDFNGGGDERDGVMSIEALRRHFKENENMDTLLLNTGDTNHFNNGYFINAVNRFLVGSSRPSIQIPDRNMRLLVAPHMTRQGYDTEANYLGKAHTATFDTPAYFGQQHVLRIGAEGTKVTPVKPPKPGEALLLALDIAIENQIEMSTRQIVPNNSSDLQHAMSVLNNARHFPLAEYMASVQGLFSKFEIPYNKEFRRKRAAYFVAGSLNAPDIFEPANRKTLETSLDHLIRSAPQNPLLTSMYSRVELLDYWSERVRQLRGLNEGDIEILRTIFDNIPALQMQILSNPTTLAIFATQNDPRLQGARATRWLRKLPKDLTLPAPLLERLISQLPNDNEEIPEIFSTIALEIFAKIKIEGLRGVLNEAQYERLVDELRSSYKDEETKRHMRLAAESLHRLGALDLDLVSKRVRKHLKDPEDRVERARARLTKRFFTPPACPTLMREAQ